MSRAHQPVLLEEAIAALMVSADGSYVDGTFGRGGHSTRILDALSPSGALLGLDQDPAAESAARHLIEQGSPVSVSRCQFSCVGRLRRSRELAGCSIGFGGVVASA
jgi:16S rRNA (cytosine1402-N4)-methyltransferase